MGRNFMVPYLKCHKCGHEWVQRKPGRPGTCPNIHCRCATWYKPRPAIKEEPSIDKKEG